MKSFVPKQSSSNAFNLFRTLKNKYLQSLGKDQPKTASPNFPAFMLSPFQNSNLNTVPAEWTVSGPDFVGIGAPKAGTSWWSKILREHPQIKEHRLFSNQKEQSTKELQYFPHFGYRGMEEEDISNYRQAFAAPEGSICGEWSVLYLCQPHCIEYLAQSAPSAKILVMLRNPIDRTISHLNHVLKNRVKHFNFSSEQKYMFETYSLYPEVFFHSLYAHALRQLLRYFKRENILLLQYEKCKLEPEREASRTYDFLGVDDSYRSPAIHQKINRQDYIVPQLDRQERRRLANYFFDDVRGTLELFPEIDLSLWSGFRQEDEVFA